MSICPDCKAENIPGADFCASCGHDLHKLDHPIADDTFSYHLTHDTLGSVQSREVPIVSPRDPVAFAVHRMQETNSGCVLVKEGERLVGILTERDILLKASGPTDDLNAVTVAEAMTPDPIVLRAEDVLAVALHKMSVGEFRHIPLMVGGQVTRVVSIRDVFRYISPFIHEEPVHA
jgi:CBS domain-containing protein